jgi:hypothetical protein
LELKSRLSQPLEETEHFGRWRQKQVAKIAHCGLPEISTQWAESRQENNHGEQRRAELNRWIRSD